MTAVCVIARIFTSSLLNQSEINFVNFSTVLFTSLISGIYIYSFKNLSIISAIVFLYIGLVQATFVSGNMLVTEENFDIYSIVCPTLQSIILQQSFFNYKLKIIFCFIIRNIIIIGTYLIHGQVSLSYVIASNLVVVYMSIDMYDKEINQVNVYKTHFYNIKQKLKWINLFDRLPFFVIIYNKESQSVTNLNSFCKNLIFKNQIYQHQIKNFIEYKQKIKIYDKQEQEIDEKDINLKQLFNYILEQNLEQLQIKLTVWNRKCILTCNAIEKDEIMFLFQDVNAQNYMQSRETSLLVSNQLCEKLTLKLLNPINSIKALFHINKQQVLNRGENYDQNILTIDELLQNMITQIQSLTDFSIILFGRIQLNLQTYNLYKLIQDSYNQFIQQAKLQEINYRIELNQNLKQYFDIDFKKINLILWTLINNAIKYTKNGLVQIKAKIKFINDERNLRIVVIDNGSGMEQHLFNKITTLFQFRQQNNLVDLSQQQFGTGFSLNIVKKLIHSQNGKIFINSAELIGTKIKIYIPILIQQNESDIQLMQSNCDLSALIQQPFDVKFMQPFLSNQQKNDNIQIAQINMKILIVDDDQFNLYALTQLIKTKNINNIETAVNGEQAIEKVVNNQQDYFNIIIMDVNMPIMDGVQATKKLRQMHLQNQINLRNTKIYMHSAISDEINWKEIFDAKLTKPLIIEELDLMIHNYKRQP